MVEIVIDVPEGIEKRLRGVKLEKVVEEALTYEAKKRMLLELIDDMMKGAKQLSDEELAELGRKIKKGRFKKLKEKGLV